MPLETLLKHARFAVKARPQLPITHAQLGLVPPTVITGAAIRDMASSSCLLHANLADLGENETVEVGFQYRLRKLLTESSDEWQESAFERLQSTGEYSAPSGDLENGKGYEFRAVARHQKMAVYGDSVTFQTG